MSRRACLYLVGSFVLVALAGCGGGWLMEQREPWRHEAEVACLKSGQVKISPVVAQMPAITGPGRCGADFPLKVAALGESEALGFAEDLRPPGAIPQYRPVTPRPVAAPGYGTYPQSSYPDPYPQRPYASPPSGPAYPAEAGYPAGAAYPAEPGAASPGAPLSLKPPGADPEEDDTYPPPAAPGYGRPAVSRPAPLPEPHAPRPYSTREGPYDPPGSQPPEPYYTPAPRNHGVLGPYGAQPGQATEPLPSLGPADPALAGGPAAVMPAATLACPMVSALDQWVVGSVQPAALRWFGQQVVEIRQISAYSCRGMNGNPRAHISEHAFGNALDIAAFTLADGRKVTVKDGWRGLPEERGFLHDVHAAACQQFSTVLGPGSNVYHYDHLHLDLMRRSSGRSICNPAAIPGDLVAGRMGYSPARQAAAERTGRAAEVTGSVGTRASRAPPLGFAAERTTFDQRLPVAVPGAD